MKLVLVGVEIVTISKILMRSIRDRGGFGFSNRNRV